jgi:hypothetical protein
MGDQNHMLHYRDNRDQTETFKHMSDAVECLRADTSVFKATVFDDYLKTLFTLEIRNPLGDIEIRFGDVVLITSKA